MAQVGTTFAALADPTRRAILSSLRRGSATVSELAQPHRMSLPAVMKHLRILESAGLVRQHKLGRVRHCRLVAAPLEEADRWIAHYRSFWENQLESLDRYLSQSDSEEEMPWPKLPLPRKSRSK